MHAEQRAGLRDAIAMEMTKPPDWPKLRATIETYGDDLLSDAFDHALGAMIAHLQTHRHWLKQCRSLGTDATFRRYGVGGPHIKIDLATLSPLAAELFQTLNQFDQRGDKQSDSYTGLLRALLGEIEPTEQAPFWAALQDRLGNALARRAERARSAHVYEEAVAAYDHALEVRSEHVDANGFASTQNNRGIALQAIATLTACAPVFMLAADAFEAAVRVWTQLGFSQDLAMALNNLGDCQRAHGDHDGDPAAYRRAIDTLRRALSACDAVLFPDDAAMIRKNLGATYLRLGECGNDPADLPAAIEILTSVLATLGEAANSSLLQNARKDLANAKRLFGERNGHVGSLREAVALLRDVIASHEHVGHAAASADARADLASALLKLGEFEAGNDALVEAILVARRAVESLLTFDDPRPIMAARNSLGVAMRTLGLREASPDLLGEAANVFREIRADSTALGTSVAINFSATLQSLGDLRRDEDAYREAVAVSGAACSPELRARRPLDWATLMCGQGDAWFGLGQLTADENALDRAIASYRAALEERTPERTPIAHATVHNNLGNTLRVLGRIRRRSDLSRAAIKSFRGVLTRFRLETIPFEWATATKCLALAHVDLGQCEDAAEVLTGLLDNILPAISVARDVEEERRLLRVVSGASDELAHALVKLRRLPEAVNAIDRGRAIGLHDWLALRDEPELRNARENWRMCCEAARLQDGAMVMATGQIAEDVPSIPLGRARQAADAAHAELMRALNALRDRQTTSPSAQWYEAVPDDGALAVVVAGASGGAVVVVWHDRGGEPQYAHQEIPALTQDAIDELLDGSPPSHDGWLRHYASLPRAAWELGAHAALEAWNGAIGEQLAVLWDLVMGPLDGLLRRCGLSPGSDIVLVSPGRLSLFPLHAARRTAEGRWRYFAEDWTTARAASPRSAAACRRHAAALGSTLPSLLAVTDPLRDIGVTDNPAWRAFEGRERRRLDGAAATVDAVCAMASTASVISFYCHAEWDPDDPENSALLLADSDRLTIRQWRWLDLATCRMAILAACETGVPGVHEVPDEFVGLPGALVRTGVPGVFSTLWPVEASTTFAMVALFLAACRKGNTPAAALRDAQISFLNGSVPATAFDGEIALQGPKAARAPGGVAVSVMEPAIWAAFIYTGS